MKPGDVACGTGVLARAALGRVGAEGRVTGVDLNSAMLSVARIAGRAAADALRTPFALGDTGEQRRLFESAGTREVDVTTITGEARFPTWRSMVEADLRGWLPVMGVHLDESTIEEVLGEAETALSRFVGEEGQLVFDSPAHIVTGKKE